MKSVVCSLTVFLLVTSILFHFSHGKNRHQGKQESCRRAPSDSDVEGACDADSNGHEEGLKKYDKEHQTEHENEEEIIYEYDSDDDDFEDLDDAEDDDDDDEDDGDDKENSEMIPDGGKLRTAKKNGGHTGHERRDDKSKSESAKKGKESSKGNSKGKQRSEKNKSKDEKHFKKVERKGNGKQHGSTHENEGRAQKGKRTGSKRTEHETKESKEEKVAKSAKPKKEPDTKGDRSGSNDKEDRRHNGKDKRKKEKDGKNGKNKHSKHGEHTSNKEASSQETFPEGKEEKHTNFANVEVSGDEEVNEDAVLMGEASQVSGPGGTSQEKTGAYAEAGGSLIEKAKDTSAEGNEEGSDETETLGDNINSIPSSYTDAPEMTGAGHMGEARDSPAAVEENMDNANSVDVKVDSQTEFTTKPDDATMRAFLTTAMEFDSTIMLEEDMRVGKEEGNEEGDFEKNGWESNVSGGRGVEPEVSTDGTDEEKSIGDGSVVLEAPSSDVNPLPEVSAEYVTSTNTETETENTSDDFEQ